MCTRFVENAARVREQQKIEDIAKISIRSHQLQRAIFRLHCILFSRMNKSLRELITSRWHSNNTCSVFWITVYWGRGKKQWKWRIPDIQTNRRPNMCFRWWRDLDGTLSKRMVFTKHLTPASSRSTVHFWYWGYRYRNSLSHRGKWKPIIGKEQKMKIKKIFQANRSSFLWEAGVIIDVHQTTV